MSSCISTTQPPDEAAAYTRASQSMYAFFAPLFLHEMNAQEWRAFLARLETLPCFCEEGALAHLQKTAQSIAGLPEKDVINELASGYAKMFLGVSDKPPIPLVQSFYTSSEKLAYQAAFFQAQSQYQRLNLALDPQVNLPEDHLGVILAFLAHCANAASQDPCADNMANLVASRNKLLANWLPQITEMASTHYAPTLYTALLAYLQEFVNYDQQEMKILCGLD